MVRVAALGYSSANWAGDQTLLSLEKALLRTVSSGGAQPLSHLPRQVIDYQNFLRGGEGNIRLGHSQFAGEHHGREAFTNFAAQLLFHGNASLRFLRAGGGAERNELREPDAPCR